MMAQAQPLTSLLGDQEQLLRVVRHCESMPIRTDDGIIRLMRKGLGASACLDPCTPASAPCVAPDLDPTPEEVAEASPVSSVVQESCECRSSPSCSASQQLHSSLSCEALAPILEGPLDAQLDGQAAQPTAADASIRDQRATEDDPGLTVRVSQLCWIVQVCLPGVQACCVGTGAQVWAQVVIILFHVVPHSFQTLAFRALGASS